MMRGPFDVYRCCGGVAVDGTIYGMTVRADCDGALRDGMRRLADLMDPTCHPVPSDGNKFKCSECGEHIGAIGAVFPRYCPCCGARVVSG